MTNIVASPFVPTCCSTDCAGDRSLITILAVIALIWLVLRLRRSRSRKAVTRTMIFLVVVSLLVLAGVMGYRNGQRAKLAACQAAAGSVSRAPAEALPALVEIGAETSAACRPMDAVVAELRKDYDGRLKVYSVDAESNPDAAPLYKVQSLPTQVFYDPAGKELFRHEGVLSAGEIVNKWAELGHPLSSESPKPK